MMRRKKSLKDHLREKSQPVITSSNIGFIGWKSNTLVNIVSTQEEKPMCYETDKNAETLRYASARLRDIYYIKERDIERKFAAPWPEDYQQAAEWLKEKNFHLTPITPYAYSDPFVWGKEPVDHEAQSAATIALNTAYQSAKDKIVILSDEEKRLDTLKEFEAYTIH